MLFKKTKKPTKKMMARIRMRRVQTILLAIVSHKKNTNLIKSATPYLKSTQGKKGFKTSLRKLKKMLLPSRKRAKDKWG